MIKPTPVFQSSSSHPLDLQVSYRLGAPLIYVKGELDHQTAPQLRAAIKEEWASAPPAVILELSEVTYLDSGGLSVLFDTLTWLRGAAWLGAVGPIPPVARLLEMTGLTEQPDFRAFADLDAAALALKSSAAAH
jgi:anti-sigma B factor antagonist